VVRVLLQEEKVLAHLGTEEEKDARVLVLDTGATNHMSISRTAFKDLHTVVYDNYSVGACTFHEVAAWTQRSSYSTKSVLWYGRANSEIHNSKWKNN
jgi:hypothetical protein